MMVARKKVEISFVLDETGSMAVIAKDTIGSFNTFVEEQKKLNAEVTFSLVLFSLTTMEDTYRKVHESVRLDDVKLLDRETYRPRGNTPLLDAVGSTIDSLGARLAAMPEHDRPDQVIVVILTDGEENASKEYTLAQVREKVQHQREVYKWEVIFLGCGIDAYAVGGSLGIARAATSSYAATASGVQKALNTASRTVSSLVDDSSVGGASS
jgi:hypothetical protein